ncbi:MAG TPA: LysR substrate-binding domain-containing protein [Afipia sp.]
MQLSQIRTFLAVRETGSLRAAARHIGISQPAISKAMSGLESELQAQLFIRTSRGIRLTEAGRMFGARAAVVQAELGRAREELSELSGGSEGSVSMGVGPAGIALLPRALARFRAERPNARIHIREGTRDVLLPLIRDGSLDFSISDRGIAPVEGGLVFRMLYQSELVIASRKGHPLARATSLSQLADASWILVYRLGHGGALEQAFAAAGVPASPIMRVRCESHASALTLIADSDLLGLVPKQDLQAGVKAGFLQRVEVRERLGRPRIGAFMRADTPPSLAAQRMLHAITAASRSTRGTAATS